MVYQIINIRGLINTMINISGIVFEESKVTGKVYQYVCGSCQSEYWKSPSGAKFWTEYVLTAERKKDMTAKVQQHIITYHSTEGGA